MPDEYSEATKKMLKRARDLAIHTKTPWARKLLRQARGMPIRRTKPKEDDGKRE